MASVNKVILVGNLGRDPEVRYMPNGDAVANYSIATTETWKDKNGMRQEKTEWHNIVMYRRLAEIAGEYLKKGSSVYIEGRLQTRKWQDKQGNDRYTTEIVADQMQMLGGRNSGGGGGGYEGGSHDGGGYGGGGNMGGGSGNRGGNYGAPQGGYDDNQPPRMRDDTPPPPRRQEAKPAANFDDMDDDIFTTYIFARLSCQYELDRTRNFKPDLTGCHTGCDISRSHTG